MTRIILLVAFEAVCFLVTAEAQPAREPIVRAVDLDVGESATLALADGSTARVKLLNLSEETDSLRGAIRSAEVTVEIHGEKQRTDASRYTFRNNA